MKIKTKIIALAISVVMIVCALPVSLFATQAAGNSDGEKEIVLEGVNVTLGAEIAINYYLSVNEEQTEELTATFTYGEKTETVALSEAEKTANGVKLSLGLNVLEIALDVTLTLSDSEGNPVQFATAKSADKISEYTYSMKQYAINMASSKTVSTQAKAAAKSILIYAYFAEVYFGKEPSDFSGILSAEDIEAIRQEKFGTVGGEAFDFENITSGDPQILGDVSLVLESYTKIRIYLKVEEEPTVTSENAYTEVLKNGNEWCIDVCNIAVSDFDTVYTFYVNGTKTMVNLLSVANIIALDEQTNGADYVNLAKALYAYYHYIEAFMRVRENIEYNVNGGTLPGNAPYKQSITEQTTLPIPTNGTSEFLGWYTTETFDDGTKIDKIPANYGDKVTVYAKWRSMIINADFSKEDVGINVSDGKSATALGISFGTSGKAGASFVSGVDTNGAYVLWTKGSADSVINPKNNANNISTVSENQVSYHFVFSKNGEDDLIAGDIRLYPRSPLANKKLGNQFSFITISADGSIKLLGETIVNAKEVDVVDLRIVIDFEVSKIYLYDKDGNVIHSKVFTPSLLDMDGEGKNNDSVSSLDFKKYMSEYVLYWYSNSKDVSQSIKIRTIKLAGGNIFGKTVAGEIEYDLGGGTLPSYAPSVYYKNEITTLPTPTRDGYTFAGWYTTSTFNAATSIIALDSENYSGNITVYAKWNLVLINSDYSDAGININATEKWASAAGIAYDANGKAGASYITVDEGNGNKYLVWTVGTADPSMNLKGDGNDLTNSDSSVISFTFKLSKNGSDNLPANISARFIANRDVNGGTISSKQISFFTIKNGVIKLGDKEVIGELSESITELRIVVDFDALTFTAYTTDGKVKSTVSFDIPTATKAETGRELMKCFTGRIINIYNSTSSLDGSIRFYEIKVEEGNPFKI